MVTTVSKEFKCSICGNISKHNYIVNSSADGDSELDLRPSEPHRSSMMYWTMTCPVCGYCHDNIENNTNINADFLKSEKYLSLDGIKTDCILAQNFIKKAIISAENNDFENAFQSYIYASWAFDDSSEIQNAVECRNRAINFIDKAFSETKNHNLEVLKCDLLRRAGRFDEVKTIYKDKSYNNPAVNALIKFEILKSEECDSSPYKFGDIKLPNN